MLTPGDSVRIEVWRKPEFSGDFVVAPDGSITHPLYRSVRVAGVPFATAEANLRRFLSGFEENPQFVMEPLIRVAVSGEVTRPTVFATRPETTDRRSAGPRRRRQSERRPQPRSRHPVHPDRTAAGALGSIWRTPSSTDGSCRCAPVTRSWWIERKSFSKDILLPTLGVIGSIASVGLLIDRIGRGQ